MNRPNLLLIVFLFACVTSATQAQSALSEQKNNSSEQQSAQALSLLTQAMAAFWPSGSVQAVELDGGITSHIPPGKSGRAIVKVEPSGRSSFEADFGSDNHVESTSVRDDHSGCQQTGANGTSQARAIHNCFLAANPFLPLVTLTSYLSDSSISLSNGSPGSAVQVSLPLTDADPGALPLLKHLSSMIISFDSQTHLPLTLDYNEHPEKNAKADIPVQMRYSDYESVSGVMIPHSIQKYINGGLVLDLRIDSVKFY